MRYKWIYYGRKSRRILLFSIKFIDFLLLYLVAGKQLYLTIILLALLIIFWIIGSVIALVRRKIKYGMIKDRPKSEDYLYPNHDRRENVILLVCTLLLILEIYLISLPLPN